MASNKVGKLYILLFFLFLQNEVGIFFPKFLFNLRNDICGNDLEQKKIQVVVISILNVQGGP